MGALFAGLQGLIITVKRNAWSSVLTTLMLILLIIAWSARDNISTFLERNPSAAQEKDRFGRALKADGQINASLEDVRKRLNADRILIRQFHNSKTDLTGLPFASVSTTYYALAPGVSLVDNALDPQPLSMMNEMLGGMFPSGGAPRCAKLITREVNDPVLRGYFEAGGAVLVYSCPLMNLRGQPVGVIGVGYLTEEKHRPTDDEITSLLSDTGERVVGYLNGVIAQEKSPWYQTILDAL